MRASPILFAVHDFNRRLRHCGVIGHHPTLSHSFSAKVCCRYGANPLACSMWKVQTYPGLQLQAFIWHHLLSVVRLLDE